MKIVRYTGAAVAFAMLCMTRDALAFPLDKPAGDSYPTDVNITSPAGQDSLFTFINFTGLWKGGTETCRTSAFSVIMQSSGTTYPYTSPGLTGAAYSFASGTFRIVSSGFNIADIAGTSCTHKTQLQNLLSVGHNTNDSGMKIDVGYPTYDYDSNKVSGS